MAEASVNPSDEKLSFEEFKQRVLRDYRLACESREASLLGRKEVLTGKAKFGIFGDGKELPQLAMAHCFKAGDYKAGYYRDQTFMFASGVANVEQFFAQLYAHPDKEADPFSAGRQMNAHFATPFIDEEGKWLNLQERYNISADASPTASQMGRSVGLALASKYYRNSEELAEGSNFSSHGNEVCFVTIGDASTSEGIFWEAVNAAGVQQIPMAIFVWDDGYGISVPIEYQTTKGSISQALAGMQADEQGGLDIYQVDGWDYPALCETFERGIARTRETHIPAVFHVRELTQPQGHSTSGSHERYKSPERLQWEKDYDGIAKMRQWILDSALGGAEELEQIESEAKQEVREAQKRALKAYRDDISIDKAEMMRHLDALGMEGVEAVQGLRSELSSIMDLGRRDLSRISRKLLYATRGSDSQARRNLKIWLNRFASENKERYNSQLYSEGEGSALAIPTVAPEYDEQSPKLNGFEILNRCFEENLKRDPAILAFGEDLGNIGDVNQGFAGLQEKFGLNRVFDTGIREATIMGQGIGLAMRGLRPIAEIQYLDYLLYGLQPLSDDLATLHYRSAGQQKAPMIVRTRGHRLEGIWHTGSPIGMILSTLRGMHVLVPRNMTQAAGFYNTLLRSDDPAIIIECLNGYRLKEQLPNNIGEFCLPLGIPEVIRQGEDITIVSYGSILRIAQQAAEELAKMDIQVEILDVQTLLPYDLESTVAESVRKTNRVLFLDEDVPGGATAFMLSEFMKDDQIWQYLDSAPRCLSAHPHRSPYGSDGDYFSKPNTEDIIECIYEIMHETDPDSYPEI
jgi:pyruvate/2-oxoglutarate/acetoin dehydrogenase E1 component/TPP-dependent pyruvate/acetoin dehydrogenase alpha subunit